MSGCYNKPVTVRLDLGRNKFVTFPATVNGIYPSLFTVAPQDKNFLGKTAYSYSERQGQAQAAGGGGRGQVSRASGARDGINRRPVRF